MTPTDAFDGYAPSAMGSTDPRSDQAIADALAVRAQNEAAEAVRRGAVKFDNMDGYRQQLLDGWLNMLTGFGDPSRDKTLGGSARGPSFHVQLVTGAEAEARWRGSDLGQRIVDTVPGEMLRRGWELTIQPARDDKTPQPQRKVIPAQSLDHLRTLLHGVKRDGREAHLPALLRVLDDLLEGDYPPLPVTAAPTTHTPGPLPIDSDESARIIDDMRDRIDALGVSDALQSALCYERAFGGGAILLGVDDGEQDLAKPLDLRRVRRLRHVTAYRGGWDGEVIAWSYYSDPRLPRFGEPEIYMLRNLGVPFASPPAPGQSVASHVSTSGLVHFVHESRLLVFDGKPVSRQACVQMRGWGDSIFTRVDEVLADYGQAWKGVSILLTEWAQGVLKVDGLAQVLASQDPSTDGILAKRAIALQMAQSIARVRIIDSKEDFSRDVVPMSGIAEVLREFALRVAASSGLPLSLLMGQVQGGLGDAAAGDIQYFYDQIEAAQRSRLLPQIKRLYGVLFAATEGPTKSVEPARWEVAMHAIQRLSEGDKADIRLKVTQADQIAIATGQVTPEEVAATRYGGSDFNTGSIVLDLDGRARMAQVQAEVQLAAPPSPSPTTGAAEPAPKPPAIPPPVPQRASE